VSAHGTQLCDLVVGAGDGIRTRDINLGKVALYQLSYSRTMKHQVGLAALLGSRNYSRPLCQNCQFWVEFPVAYWENAS
jgi:hypothetical protein